MTELVTVDIGGTHARFALATVAPDGRIALAEPVTLRTRDHASFQLAWEAFAAHAGRALPAAAALSIAGPVGEDVIRFTNNPWTLRPAELPREIGAGQITLVNDFAAVAHAVAAAPHADFLHLCGPDAPLPAAGTLSVVGPGTGLGVAHLWRDGQGGYHVQATEGGHMAFAPLDAIDDAILAHLRQRYPRVSAERVVSGPGIVELHAALAALEGRAVEQQGDTALWQLGLSGDDSLAAAAVERFCASLGSVCGDYALAHGAGAVVLAGGLGLRLRDVLPKSGFGERFRFKGRYTEMMAGIPVKMIVHPQPGLYGAAAAFANEHCR